MVKSHEINIKGASAWNQFTNNNYFITNDNTINIQDYILFRNIEIVDAETIQETGLYRIVQVVDIIIENEGLKDGYGLLILNKI